MGLFFKLCTMIFSSPQFLFVFLPLAVTGFFLLPQQPLFWRKGWLIFASLFFYAWWKWEYLALLLLSLAANFLWGRLLIRTSSSRPRFWLLVLGVAGNLGLLGYFKYSGFFLNTLEPFLGLSWNPVIILPLAISFFTFTQIAYLVDVSRNASFRYSLLDYSFFVVFFPHLIAGPIVRHWEIIPQIRFRPLVFSRENLGPGLAMLVMGLAKKTLLADPLGRYVDAVFHASASGIQIPAFDAWLGTGAFALQIYFDFSGYSDMALGLALFFGIRFPINFDSPYQASSIAEFWSRWHISLTRFLREYVYFPLGGNRCGLPAQCRNILVTMLLSGFWHGAGWTFLAWGFLHGIYLVIHRLWVMGRQRLLFPALGWPARISGRVLTLGAVLMGWVFFRASSLEEAWRFLQTMGGAHGWTLSEQVTNTEGGMGRWWISLGLRFVEPNFNAGSYTELSERILVAALLVFLAPNSQQILARYRPCLGDIRPSVWKIPLNVWSGIFLGFLFWLVTRAFLVARPNPFIYFNF
jgi:D-alanyl-lipoteichoic acid acyltransferase DltB (MBOAT superfamily)